MACLGCLIALAALGAPRIVFFILWVFTDYISDAYSTFIWPLLAIIFMPLTGLAYAFSINTYGAVASWGIVLLVLAIIFDISQFGASKTKKPRT